MFNSPLEYLAKKYENVVKYDFYGNPSIFVRFPKMKSCDLDPELPDHVHPAFRINGEEQDSILLGKYKASEAIEGGALYSMPNVLPARIINADTMLERMRDAGRGISGMTIADYGFILLLAQKEGWNLSGNIDYGQNYDAARVSWQTGSSLKVGQERCYAGYVYTCLVAHTSSVKTKPDITPLYWKRGEYVGAAMKMDDTYIDYSHQVPRRTLNGSGPMDWYLGNDPANMSDIIGSMYEVNYGYRIVNHELQIIEDNNAANPECDLSSESAAWRAILPNANDDGYTLVEPGTEGTLKWNKSDGMYYYLDTVLTNKGDDTYGRKFKNIKAYASNLPYVPYIVKELGLFPTTGSNTEGEFAHATLSQQEILVGRGGDCGGRTKAGLGCMAEMTRSSSNLPNVGARPRAIDL